MNNKNIGFIGCGNMGGAILFGALESGVLPKENAYVYDINPEMMRKAESWGVNYVQMMKMSVQNLILFFLQ